MEYEFDIAISFAGEDRTIAEDIAQKLMVHGVKVFYDRYEEASLFGEDLYERFHDVYSHRTRFCIMLISKHYAEKVWTRHERKSAQDRALKESTAYILPVRLDDTPIPGLRDTVGYFDLRIKTVPELVKTTLEKLGKGSDNKAPQDFQSNDESFSVPIPQPRKILTERDRDRFKEDAFRLIKQYFQQGINQLNTTEGFEADFAEINKNRFTCKVYANGKRVTECTIWLGANMSRETSICYVNQANQDSSSSMNEILTLQEKQGTLSFNALMNMWGSQKSSELSPQETAEYLWSKLLEPLNRSY